MAQVRHLLEHRGGWDRDKSFDAMFQSVRFAKELDTNAPADQATVIKSMFSRELDFAPGECYAYSNFGYCLLGRFIEKLSGQTCESYVRDHVLTPIGITSMKIGSSRLEGQAPNEVRYYQPGTGESVFQLDLGQDVAQPYGGWNLEAMDSHGGWIASAADPATFAAVFDNPDSCVLLRKESIDLMYQRPPGLAGFEPDGAAGFTDSGISYSEPFEGRSECQKRTKVTKPAGRRRFTREFKEEAVQLLVDGHTAESDAHHLCRSIRHW